jgi:hypothetical protein
MTSLASKAAVRYASYLSHSFLGFTLDGLGDALGVDELLPLVGAEKNVKDRDMASVILRHEVVVVDVVS